MGTAPTFEQAPIVETELQPLSPLIAKTAKAYWLEREGIRLRVMHALPDIEHPKGSIFFCPGRTEFIEKYLETIEDFLERGYAVTFMDHRGKGLSSRMLDDPTKCYVRKFDDYVDDAAFVFESFKPYLPKPHILGGHSLGGCMALMAVIDKKIRPSAIFLSAPMLALFDVETRITEYFIKFFSLFGFAKRNLPFQKSRDGKPTDFKGNKLTSDPDRFYRWADFFNVEPRLHIKGPTFNWVSESMRAMTYVNRNAAKVKIPGLIVAAGGDPIVDPASNRDFAEAAGLDYVVVPGAKHEVLMEQDEMRDQFFAAFDKFLEKQGL